MRDHRYYVYILASKRNSTLYVGVTGNIEGRIFEHKHEIFKGFSQKYHVHIFVYYEEFGDVWRAIYREKCIKKWKRRWKIELIESKNPTWRDLSSDWGR